MLSFSASLIVMGLGLLDADPTEALELLWSAPPQCPAADDVRAQLRELVADAQDPQPTKVTASVSQDAPGHWVLALDVENAWVSGHRTLRADSCEDLAGATAMIAAIAIDPFSGQPDETQTQEPSPPPDNAPPRPTPAAPSPQPETPPAFAAFWSVAGEGGAGWSADRTAVVRFVGGWERRRLALRFGSDLWLPQRYDTGEPGVGVSVATALAHLRVCGVPRWGSVAVLACGGALAGVSLGRGFGVQQPATRGSLASAVLASVGLRWTPGRTSPNLGLLLEAESAVHLTRPRFHTGESSPAYVGSNVALLLLAGAEVRFGVHD